MSGDPYELTPEVLDLVLARSEVEHHDYGMVMDRLSMLGLVETAERGVRITPTGWEALEVMMALVGLEREDFIVPDPDLWPPSALLAASGWVQIRAGLDRIL